MSYIILDLDNCISDDGWRIPRINWRKPPGDGRYHDYHQLAAFDAPGNRDLFENADNGKHGFGIIILTARPVSIRALTEEWMLRNGVRWEILMMRPEGSTAGSTALKADQLDALRQRFGIHANDIEAAYDDRAEVVDMYKARGIYAEVRRIHDVCAYTPPVGSVLVAPERESVELLGAPIMSGCSGCPNEQKLRHAMEAMQASEQPFYNGMRALRGLLGMEESV